MQFDLSIGYFSSVRQFSAHGTRNLGNSESETDGTITSPEATHRKRLFFEYPPRSAAAAPEHETER
jgi:hypothetical protein